MNTEKADLSPTRVDSAATTESVEIGKSENPVEKDPSYTSADSLKEIYSSGRGT
jgi:hypothetical protein